MKVLLVNGSPRKEGNTYTALKEVTGELARQGVDSEIVWLGNQPVRGCVACGKCKEKGNNRCVFDDDVTNRIIEKMETSDAIVVGSPVYYGQPSGQLLCMQQRMHYAAGALCKDKPAAAVAVCRRGGATAAYQTMLMPFQMTNMPIVTSQYWNIAYGRAEGESAMDEEGMQTMRTLALNMAWLLKKIKGVAVDDPVREAWAPMSFIR